ncbi:ribonuclease Z [Vulcanisaeta thermophila]|uniref:ribonuclease Z n=1 Tax=Vulcanisaeta thermophila TaxID=867917 RepID=UPI000853AE56|nr:ribonuclease Z [Vulcanisaeta thermophila]
MNVKVTFLGTGAGTPGKGRFLPSILVDDGPRKILMDAGEGAQYRLNELGISPLRITHILITHLHGDHVFGLPGLLATMALLDRRTELTLIGPVGIASMVKGLAEFIDGSQFPLRIIELSDEEGEAYVDGDFSIRYALARHSITDYAYTLVWRTAVGKFNPERAMKMEIPVNYWKRLQMGEPVLLPDGRVINPQDVVDVRSSGILKIVYTGDTAPTERVINLAKDAQLLIHDSTFSASEDAEVVWRQGHSRSVDAARVARDANVGELVLTHISNRYADPNTLAWEAAEVFPQVIAARDLLTIEVQG